VLGIGIMPRVVPATKRADAAVRPKLWTFRMRRIGFSRIHGSTVDLPTAPLEAVEIGDYIRWPEGEH
jgi:hypothetical protein